MATTSPDNLRTPNSSDPFNLVPDLQTLASDVQNALTKRANLYTGTGAQRNAFTTAPEGTHWKDTDGSKLVYVRTGSTWFFAAGQCIYSSTTSGSGSATAPTGFFNSVALSGLPNGQKFLVSFTGATAHKAAAGLVIFFGRYTTDGTAPVIGSSGLGVFRAAATGAGQVIGGGTISGIVTTTAAGALNAAISTDDAWYRPDPITATVIAL